MVDWSVDKIQSIDGVKFESIIQSINHDVKRVLAPQGMQLQASCRQLECPRLFTPGCDTFCITAGHPRPQALESLAWTGWRRGS